MGSLRLHLGGKLAQTPLLEASALAAACRPRSGSGGGTRRRSGGGQVAPPLRVHPLASPAGLAGPRERLGLVWQGNELLAGDRPPQELLRSWTATARGPCE